MRAYAFRLLYPYGYSQTEIEACVGKIETDVDQQVREWWRKSRNDREAKIAAVFGQKEKT